MTVGRAHRGERCFNAHRLSKGFAPANARSVLTKSVVPEGVGEKLDRFELISELASGGMATVFLARLGGAGGFQRLYAIKRLHPHLATDREFIQMFLDEARLAARIHHPNVVPIHEIGITPSGYYLVMEYIEGDTAARLFARSAGAGKKLPIAVGMRIMLDALAGLHAAHELRDDEGKPLEIVHRDVSPQNILVGVDGVSRITDFGVARAATRLSTTRSGQLKGKLAYMAPEQARAGGLDRRADIFAMGVCLWETLAFRRLFKGDGDAETLNRVLYEPIPTLESAVPDIPPVLNAIVMKALERDPTKRFSSAAEMADALEKAAQSLNAIAAARDVMACVEEVMGAELSQQREAVRAWLARSEPSRKESTERTARRDSVTRVERNPSTAPPAVSSLSSAIIHVPAPESTGAVGALGGTKAEPLRAPPRRKGARAERWLAALVVTAALGGIVALRWRHATPRAADATVAPAPTILAARPLESPAPPALTRAQPSPSPASSPVQDDGGNTPPLTTDDGPSASSAASKATSPTHAAQAPRPRRTRSGASAAGVKPSDATDPAIPAATSSVPDDITHNPYR
jgi:serine/threonine protein kinase